MKNLTLSLLLILTFNLVKSQDVSVVDTTINRNVGIESTVTTLGYYINKPNLYKCAHLSPSWNTVYAINNPVYNVDSRTGNKLLIIVGLSFMAASIGNHYFNTTYQSNISNQIMFYTGIGISITGIVGLINKKGDI